MDEISAKLTILFENPFWIGLYERIYKNKLEVCKITFGKEPVKGVKPVKEKINPKRMQREINKAQKNTEIGTKSQQALKLQQEQIKDNKKAIKKIKREEEAKRQFEFKQKKKKQKHKGH